MLCRCNVLYYLGTYISQSISTRLKALVYAERYGRHETMSWSWTDSYHTASHVNVIDFCMHACMQRSTTSAPPTLHATLTARTRLGEATWFCQFFMYSIPKHRGLFILKVKHGDEPRRRSRGRSISTWVQWTQIYHVNRIQSRSHTVPTNVNWRIDHKVTPQVSCRLKEAERKSKLVLD